MEGKRRRAAAQPEPEPDPDDNAALTDEQDASGDDPEDDDSSGSEGFRSDEGLGGFLDGFS